MLKAESGNDETNCWQDCFAELMRVVMMPQESESASANNVSLRSFRSHCIRRHPSCALKA